MRRKDDILWKSILEDVFDDFLRFVNPEVDDILDLRMGFEFLDKELEQVFPPENDDYSPKVIDKLVKAFTRNGTEEWILVHIEVQGQYHKDFPARMFQYFYRILDKYQKPITAYAIFTESTPKERPYYYNLDFMGTSMRYTFNTFKIANQSEEMLLADENPFAVVVLTAKAALQGKDLKNSGQRDELLLSLKLNLAKQLLVKQISKQKIRVLMNFLRYYLRFENQEINVKFEKEVEILTEKRTTMGIEEFLLDRAKREGKAEGQAEGKAEGIEQGETKKSYEVVENLIAELGLSDEQISRIAEVSIEFVQKVRAETHN